MKSTPKIPHGRTQWDLPVTAFMIGIHIVTLFALPYFSWANFTAFAIMYFVTGCVGITLTFHRLLTHRTYEVPKWFERILSTCGILAIQGSPLMWVAHHRMHHAGSDTEKDPHNARWGFWYCHMDWLLKKHPFFDDPKVMQKFARDIYSDPYYRWLEFIPNQFLIQGVLGYLLFMIGGWSMVMWGVFVRLVAVYHTTWLVNSAAHIWGYTNYHISDSSKNNWWVALLTWGEGWHNNHHTLANVAPAGHKWWEFDITYMIIRFFESVGLAKNVKTLDSEAEEVALARAATATVNTPVAV